MDASMICMGCMANKNSKSTCPACGWLEGTPPQSTMHLSPRTFLQSKYMLGRVLGQGGFGITYLAWDVVLDRKLAVKEYFPRELASRTIDESLVKAHSDAYGEQYHYGLSKFLDEAKTLAKFDGHPNIVSVKDFFQENGTAYLVMNYLEGCTLKEYLEQRNMVLSFDEALIIICHVLNALEAIHQQELLHRDISPDNIFITAEGGVIVLDFGAARHALGQKGENLSVILKPGFAPEEQYRSKGKQGPWTDIYAVAATFYLAITGTMLPESLDRLAEDHLVPPSQMNLLINPSGEAALIKALAVKAEERFRTIEDFRRALFSDMYDHDPDGIAAPYYESSDHFHLAEGVQFGGSELYQEGNVEGRVLSIGRHESNDIILAEPAVSRFHASVYLQGGRWYITDRNSTRGTYHNSMPVSSPVELCPGSRITIGETVLLFSGSDLLSQDGQAVYPLINHSLESHTPAVPYSAGADYLHKSQNIFLGGNRRFLIGAVGTAALLLAVLLFFAGSEYFEQASVSVSNEQVISEGGGQLVQGDSESFEELNYDTVDYQGGVYTGQLKNGIPHGEGTWVYKAGSQSLSYAATSSSGEQRYEGEWLDGKKHGRGRMVYPTGLVRSGIWENNIYLGPGNS